MERLPKFEEVISETNGYQRNILLGNGFSIACDECFSYDFLFQFSKLPPEIKNIFQELDTKDFELVMNKFREVTDYCYYNLHSEAIADLLWNYQRVVRNDLIQCISHIHPKLSKIVESRKKNTLKFLSNFNYIFTLNYDLLLYWLLMYNLVELKKEFGDLKDGYVGCEEYYREWAKFNDWQNVFYLHGALLLFYKNRDAYKIVADKYTGGTLLDITQKYQDMLSGKRELYEDYVIAGIDCTKGAECIEFSNSEVLQAGKTIGGVDENIIKRTQIYKTIEAHLNKELRYFEKGIKVLSLFFIDEVKKYRTETGEKGIYAQMFEECYNELMSKEKYALLKTYFNTDVEKAHNGYFSQDKKGIYKNTKGDTLADDDTYNTIMRDKEWLLSFDCPLRFIFSHSALKEGWDNPNVFQVCTLIEQKSTFTCRQKVGRGLRLCVNQEGERIEDRNINILHVMANESFAEFAETLQKEIEQETGMKFGVLQLSALMDLTYEEKVEIEHQMDEASAFDVYEALVANDVLDTNGNVKEDVKIEEIELPEIAEPLKQEVKKIMKQAEPVTFEKLKEVKCVETRIEEKTFSHEQASEIMEELKEMKVISKEGKIKDTMKAQLKAGKLDLSERYTKAAQRAIIQALEKADNRPVIRDANKEVTVKLKKQAILSPEFKELWDKIKQKTTYRVNIDTDTLIKNCVKELREMPPIPKAKLLTSTAEIEIKNAGIYSTEKHTQTTDLENTYSYVPDILRLIASETLLKHSTIIKILKQSGREQDFMDNPQLFYEKALEIISRNRHSLAIDGIKYVKLAGEEYYVQEIFDSAELLANLDRNAVQVEHSVYDYLIYDSGVENRFAKSLDEDPDVKMFFKIPPRFKIETPIGSYNPDWAVFLEKDGEQKLYFVLETKGSTSLFDLRSPERLKIHCGKQHFAALEDGIQFSEEPVNDWKEFKVNI